MIALFPVRLPVWFEVPVTPDADEARGWLETELSQSEYQEAQPGLVEKLLGTIMEWLGDVLASVQGVGPTAGVLLLGLGALLVLAVAVLVIRPRLNARRRRPGVFEDTVPEQDAASHRLRSDRAAADGDWDTALAERLRAVLRTAEERVILDRRPGRTAYEAGSELSSVFPAAADDILWLAARFDEVRYGNGKADAQDAGRAQRLDAQLLQSQPGPASRQMQPYLAVPR
ncbi:DUF4129 domain-containing protein [Arthrobacter sp. Sa2CUA1]|uniref:DUF4129 domain-containing protein n=1 Tax=Arthrobacter gallicola TaxID=2762225 RepID=A0ABR8US19_9MICC|nr:DUF4129 domain-containing protein [Arthrobacter gallicola]MBD7995367.1 DUF4129 domain-containing protein [Arthrobacter gallicola]